MKDKKRNKVKRTSRPGVLTLLLLLLSTSIGLAQSTLPVLGWRTHFSYNNVIALAGNTDRIFAATENAVFYLDSEDNSLNLINKNTGLSDVGIGTLAYDQDQSLLIIAYQNGNIDFWSETEGITNINTIKESEITGSKQLRDIQIYQNKLYISGDLGIVVFDQQRNEITETYRNLGPNGEPLVIYQTAFTSDSIFAASDRGILSASISESINKQDFNNWERKLTGIPFQQISTLEGQLYASSDEDLFSYRMSEWEFDGNFLAPIKTLQLLGQGVLNVLTEDALWVQGDISGLRILYNPTEGERLNTFFLVPGSGWIGSSNQGLLRFNAFNVPPDAIKPPGPAADQLLKPVKFDKSVHWISATGSISTFNLEDQNWTTKQTRDADGNRISNLTGIDFGLTTDPNIETPIFSSFDQGLFFGGDNLNGSTNILNDFSNSSPLTQLNDSYNNTAIASQEGLLWLTTSDRINSLHAWNSATDEWNSYAFSFFQGRFPKDLFIGSNGYKWMPIDVSRGGGLVVFDETTSRERYMNTNGGQGGLPGTEVTSFAIDDDQFIWIGTNQGICFFPNQSIILENQSLTANVPIFENRLLLRDEFITQVVIDPANRKWFGTRSNGLWLFSETGEELIYHFTTNNSPLPSNNILSLQIDRASGELFIGTESGMVSFRSDATEGTAQHLNVKIYPNPVNPSFQGEVVINGLANNALVKITDVSGKLVKESQANGSTMLWNVRDIKGARVSSGVYLVFSSSSDGVETFVGKIVVI